MSGAGGEPGLQHLITQLSAPPCSLPPVFQDLTSAAGNLMFAVGGVAAATLRAGGFLGVSPPQPAHCSALCIHAPLTLLWLLVRSRRGGVDFAYEWGRGGFPEILPTTYYHFPGTRGSIVGLILDIQRSSGHVLDVLCICGR